MLDWILIGIAVAIGFYLAPFVVMVVGGIIAGIGIAICKLFGGCK